MQYPHLDDNFIRWMDGDIDEKHELELFQYLLDRGHVHLMPAAYRDEVDGLMTMLYTAGKLRPGA